MKKLLGIIALGLLFSGNAYAGVNEPGVTSIAGCDKGLKFQHYHPPEMKLLTTNPEPRSLKVFS